MYFDGEVAENGALCEGYWRMKLRAGDMAGAAPGQFIMLKCWEGNAPFFMRPFSINSASAQDGTVALLYKLVGKGTQRMSRLVPGSTVKVMGPLGKGFPLQEGAKRIALVGRGVGAAPMRYLAERAVARNIEVYVYLSASQKEYLFDLAHYQGMGCHVRYTVDKAALVTDFFEKDLQSMPFDAAYTCGSKRLMGECARLMRAHGFPAYASLEEHMACGIGACKGCVCTVQEEGGTERYATVCKEGPVFPIERLVK